MTLDYLLPVRASETSPPTAYSVQKMVAISGLQKFLPLDSLILCDVCARWTMPSGELFHVSYLSASVSSALTPACRTY